MRSFVPTLGLSLVLAASAVLGGCPQTEPAAPPDAATGSAPVDLAKPPPVKSAMWSLAAHTNRVADLITKPSLTPEELVEVRAVIDDVAKIVRGLAVDPAAQKHPLVRKGLKDFETTIISAQAGLAKDPPDLAPLRAVPAACQACHARGKEPVPFKL